MGRKRHTDETPRSKLCASCGRIVEYRKRWARSWDSVRFCSDACRRRGVGAGDRELEDRIVDALAERARDATLCPSEIARGTAPEDWRGLMEPVRRAARRLVARGVVEIRQSGRVVDPSTARGPIRIGRGAGWEERAS